MMTEQQMRMMLEMFSNPMFKQGANEFLKIAQQRGIEEANKFWGVSTESQSIPGVDKMMAQVGDFYKNMGFVPQAKYEDLMKENANLKNENQLLRTSINELQQKYMAEHGVRAQQAWQEVVEKQVNMSRDATKGFFDMLMQGSTHNTK